MAANSFNLDHSGINLSFNNGGSFFLNSSDAKANNFSGNNFLNKTSELNFEHWEKIIFLWNIFIKVYLFNDNIINIA